MAKVRKTRMAAPKRVSKIRTAKLKGPKVTPRKAMRAKPRKRGLLARAALAIAEARDLRTRLTGPNPFEDR
jgi:hypothetical protein